MLRLLTRHPWKLAGVVLVLLLLANVVFIGAPRTRSIYVSSCEPAHGLWLDRYETDPFEYFEARHAARQAWYEDTSLVRKRGKFREAWPHEIGHMLRPGSSTALVVRRKWNVTPVFPFHLDSYIERKTTIYLRGAEDPFSIRTFQVPESALLFYTESPTTWKNDYSMGFASEGLISIMDVGEGAIIVDVEAELLLHDADAPSAKPRTLSISLRNQKFQKREMNEISEWEGGMAELPLTTWWADETSPS